MGEKQKKLEERRAGKNETGKKHNDSPSLDNPSTGKPQTAPELKKPSKEKPNEKNNTSPKSPKAAAETGLAKTSAEKNPEKTAATETAHNQETDLKAKITEPAQRKIEVLTGVKPAEMNNDFNKLVAAVKGIIAFFSGDEEGMEKAKNIILASGANKDEVFGIMNDSAAHEYNSPIPPLPPQEEETITNPDGKETSRLKADLWNPEKLSLDRKTAWRQQKTAEFAARECDRQNLDPYLTEGEQKYGVPRPVTLAIMAKESSMNANAEHRYVVKDKKTGKPIIDKATGKPLMRTNARGFPQAISSTANEFKGEFEKNGGTWPKEGVFNPRIGVLLTAWYIKQNMDLVQRCVAKGSVTFAHKLFSEKGEKGRKDKKFTIPVSKNALISADNVEAIYLCHNSGPNGYLAQCYLKEALARGDAEEIKFATEALFEFQQEQLKGRPDWQNRGQYAKEVAAVAYNINEIYKNQKHVDAQSQTSV